MGAFLWLTLMMEKVMAVDCLQHRRDHSHMCTSRYFVRRDQIRYEYVVWGSNVSIRFSLASYQGGVTSHVYASSEAAECSASFPAPNYH
jgi:hypothetical protein